MAKKKADTAEDIALWLDKRAARKGAGMLPWSTRDMLVPKIRKAIRAAIAADRKRRKGGKK